MQHISQPRQDSPPLQLHLPFDYTDDNALRKNQHPQKLSNSLSFTSRRSFQSQQLPYPSTADIFSPTSYPPFEYTAKPPIDPYYHQLKGQQQQFQQQSQHQQPQPQQQQASYPSFPSSGLHIQSQTPYGPHLQTPAPSINPSSGVIPPPSANTGANMNGSAAQGQQPEEISTIFVVGFPDDMQEREFQNMFTFSQGFEAATLKIPNKEYTAYGGGTGAGASSTSSGRAGYPYGANDPYNLVTVNQGGVVVDGGRDGTTASWPAATTAFDEPLLVPPRKQIIGFAKFRSRGEALEARDTLQGRRVDVEKGAVLKAEMAKKNLHTKRGVGGSVSVGVGMGIGGGMGNVSGMGGVNGIGGMGGLGMMNSGNVIGLGGGPGAAGAGATGTSQFSSVLGNNNVNGNGAFSPGTIGTSEGLGGGAETFAAREKQLGALGAMGFGLDFNVGGGSSGGGVNGWRNDWVEEDKEREKEKERRAGAISAMGLGLGSGTGNAFGPFGTTRGPRERAEEEDRRRREWEREREEGESGQMKSEEEEREIEDEIERDRARDTARPQAFTSNSHLHTFGPPGTTVFNHSSTGLSLTSNQIQRESLRSANISAFDAFHSVPAGLVGPTGNSSINNISSNKSNGEAPSDDPWTYDLGRRMSSLQVSSPPSVSLSGSGSEADAEKQGQGQGQTFSPTLSDAHAQAFGLAPSRGSLSNPPSSASSAAGDGVFGIGFGAGKATANVGVGTGTSAGVGSGVEREEQLALTISNGTTSPQLPSPASGGSTSAGTSTSGRGAVDQNPPINTLYVGNLPTAHTSPGAGPLEDALRALFQRSPGFRKLCFRQKANGPMCFVEFEDVAYAAQAMRDLGGNMLNGLVKGGIRLSYSKNPLGIRTPIGQQQPQQNSQQGLQNGCQPIGAADFDVVRAGSTRQEGGNSYGFMASPPPPRFFSPSPSSSSSMFVTNGIPAQYPRTQQHAYGNDIPSSTSSAFSSAFSPTAFSPYTPASSTFSPFGLSTPPPHQQKQSQIVSSSGAIPEHHQHHQAEAARAA